MSGAPDDLDPEVAAAFAGVKHPAVTSGGDSDELDPEVAAAFRGVGRQSSGVPARKPAPVKRAPVPAAKKPVVANDPELTWGQTAQGAVRNLLPSTLDAGKSALDAVLHPVKTVSALRDLGEGALSQASPLIGLKRNKAKEGVVQALEDHYRDTYGSLKGFKKAVSTDPASILMDASTVLGGVGALGKGTMVGNLATKAGSALDPIQNALRVAHLPVSAVEKAVPLAQAFYTGKSAKALEVAARAGASSDPILREAFTTHLSGRADPKEIIDASSDALNTISRERGERYVEDMKKLRGGVLQPIDWAPVSRDLTKNFDDTVFKHANGTTTIVNEGANKALREIEAKMDDFRNAPVGSPSHTLEGFDALKKAVGDIRNSYRNDPVAYQKATVMYNSVLDAIKAQEPEYARVMKDYAHASDQIHEIGATFGLAKRGRKPQAASILNRIKGAGRDELKSDLLSQLAEKDPRIPYMIAGHELSPVFPGGIRGAIGAVTTPGVFAANPIAAAAHLAALSPRAMGSTNFAAGNVAKAVAAATKPGVTRAAYYAGQARDGGVGPEEKPSAAIEKGLGDSDLKKMLGGKGASLENVTENDIDAATRMVIGEAGGESDEGKAAAIHTAINRVKSSGETLGDVIAKPYAFEAVHTGRTKSIDPNSEEYKRVRDRIVIPAIMGELQDPTGGATHFLNRSLQLSEGRQIPGWAKGEGAVIGNHTFYRGAYASGGSVGDIGPLVKRLMTQAKLAKKHEDAKTEPLLGASDDMVARALEVAQRGI